MGDFLEEFYGTEHIKLLNWPDLYYIEMETEVGLNALQKLCLNQEAALTSAVKGFENYLALDPMYKSLNRPEDQASYRSQIFEREEMILDELRKQQRYSMCLSIYSFFEGRLRAVCDLIESEFPFKIKINDLNPLDHIMQYHDYLSKVYEVNLSSVEPYFTPIKTSKGVRNLIAHHGGWSNNNKLAESIVKRIGFTQQKFGNSFQVVITNHRYILYLIEKMELYFKELLIIIDARYLALKPIQL